jgi:uncharacterized repeat protein (TIGR01451 family)
MFQNTQRSPWLSLVKWLSCTVLALTAGLAQAQVAYGISRTQTFIINPATGAATAPAVSNNYAAQVGYESSAMAVSPINGLLYMIERTTSTLPRIAAWNPATGTAVNLGATASAITGNILRSTFCPDGRWYIAGNGSAGGAGFEMYQINPDTRALVRTITVSNIPTAGSGDISCVSNGTMYVLAASDGTATGIYRLYSLTAAQMNTGGTQAAAVVGALNVSANDAPNGLVEVPDGSAGCTTSPCLFASGTPNGQLIWRVNSSTGAATTVTTASGANLVDLSREFPRDVSGSKTATPTVALQGRTLTYTVRAANSGPAVAGSVTVADTLNPAVFNVAASTWTCAVTNAGATTAVTTACGAASGTGNINSYANLSINGSVSYTITAPLLSTFTGTATNTVAITLTGTTVDVTPSNNTVTVTSTVSPAATLTIAKTNAVGTLTAGQTTSYTITVINSGPGNATNTVVADPATTGLSCTAVTCSVASGAAVCPVAPALSIANLQGSGVTVATFPANSSLDFVVTCSVTATGTP